MTSHLRILALIGSAITLVLAPMAVRFQTKITYNSSPSAPVGFYWVEVTGELKRGVYVVVPTPPAFRLMAAKRHYLPINVPLIKRVVGLSGDEICRYGEIIYINEVSVATALKRDRQERFLPVWHGCRTLNEDQFFALMDASDSFDGRYFGPLNKRDVIGIATPFFDVEFNAPAER